jgi:hypothetical protein
MAKKKQPEPTKIVKTVELTEHEQQALVGLITQVQEWTAKQTGKQAELLFWQELNEKIMSEKEAAAYLKRMGFDIVDKQGRPVTQEELDG